MTSEPHVALGLVSGQIVLGRFSHELWIIALAPGCATRKVDLLGAKEPPDISLMHVAKRPGDERTRPFGVTLGRFRVEKGQDAPLDRSWGRR